MLIGEECAGWSVERVLREQLGVSGRMLQRLTRRRAIRLNGRRTFLARLVRPGDRVSFFEEPRRPAPSPQPEAGKSRAPVPLLWSDEHYAIVDKPAGLLCHRTGRSKKAALADLLAPQLGWDRIHLVHRLDRDSSGALLVARTSHAHHLADRLLRAGAIERTYLALVAGLLERESFTIDAPIARDPGHRTRRRVDPAGAPARTHVQVLARCPAASMVHLRLESGRTHQLRVHLAHLGHPLCGDRLYAGPPAERLALHASGLRFEHPLTAELIAVEAPQPPALSALQVHLWSSCPEIPDRPPRPR